MVDGSLERPFEWRRWSVTSFRSMPPELRAAVHVRCVTAPTVRISRAHRRCGCCSEQAEHTEKGSVMRKTFAMALLVLVVGSGIGASSAGVAGATVSTNLASSCQPGASAAFNHSGTLHTYWAQVTLRCSVINKFTVTVKQNGTTMASLTKSYTNLNPAMPYPAVSSPNVPVVPGDRYQVVVTAIDASGGSLGYMTSGAPQVLV